MNTNDQLVKWFVTDDAGTSSRAIAAQLSGNGSDSKWSDYPCDAGDFGRCYRLLKAVPSFRPRIGEMASRSPQWTVLTEHWDELERLYETDEDAFRSSLHDVLASAPDPRSVDIGGGISIGV